MKKDKKFFSTIVYRKSNVIVWLICFGLFPNLISSCDPDQKKEDNLPSPIYSLPKTIKLNVQGGYTFNTITGDRIQALINSAGDTVRTGISIPTKGTSIMSEYKVRAIGNPYVVKINSNVSSIIKEPVEIVVDINKLRKSIPGNGSSFFILKNSKGDTIPTGIAIPAIGKVQSFILPEPIQALPFRLKDNANYDIQFLDANQGMNSPYIWTVFEDKRNNLWFGTDGGGVSCYDGKTFTHFTEKEGFSNSGVRSIMEDKLGNLWFSTYGSGVIRFDGKSFTHYSDQNGLSSNQVRCSIVDKYGNLWFGTKSGINRFNGTAFTYYTEKEGLLNNDIQSIFEDKNGKLWFGTDGGGVSSYDGKSFVNYTEKEGLANNYVLSIAEDKIGNLWFGTRDGGVSKFNEKSFTNYTTKEGLSDNNILSIVADVSGNLWFGTDGGGVTFFDGSSFTYYTENEGLSNNIASDILEDSSGKIWIATFGGGVSRFNRNLFKHFTKREGFSGIGTSAILQDKSGNLWFGTDGDGIGRFDWKSLKKDFATNGLPNDNIRSIYQDINGDFWIGTDGEILCKYNGKSITQFTFYLKQEGLYIDGLSSIIQDKKGILWFATDGGGIVSFDGKLFTNYTEKEGLSNNKIRVIYDDKKGNLWIGTEGGGLIKFDGRSFTIFTEKEGLSNNWVNSIVEDNRGNLWLGTLGGGISRFDGKSFTHYTEKEGLSNNRVRSISEDKDGNLWIGTDKGLNHFVFKKGPNNHPEDVTEKINVSDSLTIFVYGNADGLKGVDFYLNGALIDRNNHAWWGTGKGLVMLDMDLYSTATKPPEVHLTQLDLDDKFLDYRNLNDSLSKNIKYEGVQDFYNYPLNLQLPYHKNHLTFKFVGIDWAAPQKIKYSYKLEGLNTEWSPASFDTKADYRNIPYGEYTFKICAIGESQEWSPPFSYTFTILPPPWLTWWAYCLYTVIFIAGVLTVHVFQKKRVLQKEKEKAQKRELEQAKVIEKAYKELKETQAQLIQSEKMASLGELTAGIAHEIQNPLNFVNNFSEVNNELIDELNDELNKGDIEEAKAISKDIKENEQKIHHHGQRASGIVKGMLEHSRTGSGKKELIDINKLADEYFRLAYHGLRAKDKTFNADFKAEFDETMPKLSVIPQDIGRVFLNLINNAFYVVDKKAKSGIEGFKPEVLVKTKKHGNYIEIRVLDNGTGVPEEIKDKIFQPFFTTKPTGSGTGLGLSLSYDIVKAHGGELKVETEADKGSEFIIQLPYQNN